jgi:hypothetical protein
MQICENRLEECVSVKKITLYVSSNAKLPESMAQWSTEDTELILSVGHAAFIQAKLSVGATNYREVVSELEKTLSQKYKDELAASREKVEKAERESQFHKERMKLMQEEEDSQIQRRLNQSKDVFDSLLESYKREREDMQSRILQLERENETAKTASRQLQLETEQRTHKDAIVLIGRELESMRQMLNEKDKQIELHKDMFERSIAKVDNLTQKRDVASIGKIGEGQFKGLANNTFRDFDGFQLKEVCSIGGLGDFHMQFKEMTILVDSKLYTNKVNSTSRDKIKRDLLNNEHIHFAWLVSMDTSIDRFDKAPFMFEWINGQKCVCYINNLRGQEEPGELLRSAWYCCKALQQMMVTDANDKGELSVLKEREMKMRDVVAKLVKSNRERDTILSQMRQNFERSDEYVRELMNKETAEIVNDYYLSVVEWWNRNLESATDGEASIKSTTVWTQFKRDMGENLGNIDAGSFKDVLCGFLAEANVIKPKAKNGALEIRGYKWRDGVKLYDAKK